MYRWDDILGYYGQREKACVPNASKAKVYAVEFNKENSLDPVCTNEICTSEDMFIGGTHCQKQWRI